MQTDAMERLGRSLVQHGPGNDRIYLMHLDMADYPVIVPELVAMAERHGYSKIFAKIPAHAEKMFLLSGFEREATAPGLFRQGKSSLDALFVSRFMCSERSLENRPQEVDEVLRVSKAKACNASAAQLPDGYTIRSMTEDDVREMARIYDKVFPSYPFPIQNPDFLRKCLRSNVRFVGAIQDGNIAALASAEISTAFGTAEMTDFATLPEHLGKRLAQCLLCELETLLPRERISTAYTIARAVSHGMNITFARAGYTHGGTLVNNTNISGNIESMNVWHKALRGGN